MKIKEFSIAKTIVALTAAIGSLFARGASFEAASQADIEKYAAATGGDEVRKIDNGDGTVDFIHIFTDTSASAQFTVPADNAIRAGSGRILVVGGGGSGSGNCGGGGGAGGLIYKEGLTVGSGTVTVGAGGAQSPDNSKGNNGSDTTVSIGSLNFTAFGGGTGGMYQNQAGSNGGSGGGGSGSGAGGSATQTGQNGYYGNVGGAGANNNRGGGGGGAGSAGEAAVSGGKGGDGGAGLEFDISGEKLFYAAGGGGGTLNSDTNFGLGGSGIGGNGRGRKNAAPAGAGKAGTGSGGGGAAGGDGSGSIGGAGGSGVVIIRYTVKNPVEVPENVKNKVYSFKDTESGTIFRLSKAVKADVLVVGGGGAGANPGGASNAQGGAGGGGAGGMIEEQGVYFAAGTYDIIVGHGGISPEAQGIGGNGESSKILLANTTKYEAFGGGGGGIRSVGSNGGSGGGGSKADGGLGTTGQGFSGGKGDHNRAGGGGGGAGGNGGDTIDVNVAGLGGDGKSSSITGSEVYYAAGGGGGTRAGAAAALGGSGIGGNGGYSGGSATNGRKNSGSGGGGGRLNERGGNGGSGVVVIRVIDVLPEKPSENYTFDYDGANHILYKGSSGATITKDGEEVSEIAVKDVGTYTYKVTLNEGYKWADLTDSATIEVKVTINAPTVTVESLSIEQWQAGQTPKKLNVTTTPFQVSESDYVVKYSPKGAGNWSEAAPAEAGEYDVTIEFKETNNFTVAGTIPVTSVTLWAWNDSDKYLDSLGYHSKITITATNETHLTDFPMLIKIKEGTPKGFEYKYANPDGSDIRFIDSEGNLLAHEFDTWDTTGESIIWVKVPQYFKGATITMCWGELVDKKAPAALDPKEVWSGYVGVWHMDDAEDAKNGGVGTFGSNTSAYNGPIGKARGNKSNGGGAILSATNRESIGAMNTLNGNTDPESGAERGSHSKTFTASFWVYLAGNSSANAMIISRKTSTADEDRWGLSFRTANNYQNVRYFYKDDLHVDDSLSKAISKTTWHRMDIIFDDWYDHNDGDIGSSTIWIDGVRVDTCKTASTFAAPTDRPLRVGGLASSNPLFGRIDELRVRQGTLPLIWMRADYDQVKNTRYEFEETKITPGAYFKNRWLREPSVTKTLWFNGEEPAEADAGEAVYGKAYYTFTSLTDTVTNSVPTELGGYVFTGQVDGVKPVENGSFGYEPLRGLETDVVISDASPDSNLSGAGGNTTLAGRVLLANDWGDGAGSITGQDYSNTNSANVSYWVHSSIPSSVNNAPYLSKSTESELCSANGIDELCGARTIWHLENIRIGNWYQNISFNSARNYLPWSIDALPNGAQSESSHLVMRNTLDAAIYSPCYTNGIGTIYFDAVNALAATNGVNYKIVLEICTNTVNGVGIPTDENVLEEIKASVKEDAEGNSVYQEGVTNRYGNAKWESVKMFALKRDGTLDFEAPFETDELALEISNGGTAKNFYRVYAKLNYNGPIRFRIRRVSRDEDVIEDSAFILVDNVIASYPSMRADLDTYGVFNGELLGKQTLGFAKAFNVSIPSVNDSITGRGRISYTVSAANPNADVSKFITSSKIFYRWRYLEQKFTEWRGITLDHQNGFNALEPFDLPKGKVGDVEYYYVNWLNAPFYDYVDYSGADLKLGGYYTENNAIVTNRLDSPVKLESRGTDWFVRLREGKSDFEKINIVVVEEKDEYYETTFKTNTIAMELVGDSVWRGVYQTLEANPKGFKYRIEAFNRQSDESGEWINSTNLWKLAENWTSLPVSDVMIDAASTNDWATLPCDAVTGYVLFQLDDTTKAITIVHADYQNFNAWNDANKGAEIFVGNSTEDGSKTGAAPQAVYSKNSFRNWKDMPVTDEELWMESFTTDVAQEYADYSPFEAPTRTPNGWTADRGMYVYGLYRDGSNVNGKPDRAIQLQGQGEGYVEFVNAGKTPRGIESLSFSARLAQAIEFTDFCYYDAADKVLMTNYTFIAPANFDLNANRSFSGNASLSLVAYYQPGVGCYEFRLEQRKANKNRDGIDPKGQKLSIYRWRYDDNGDMVSKCLYETENNFGNSGGDTPDWPSGTAIDKEAFVPLYISVSNAVDGVVIAAGYMKSTKDSGAADPLVSAAYDVNAHLNNKKFNSIKVTDTSGERITCGTYGLLSANCEGVFANPKAIDRAVGTTQLSAGKITDTAVDFGGGAEHDTSADITGMRWVISPGRMTHVQVGNGTTVALKAKVPAQTVDIYFAPTGTTFWQFYKSIDVSTFGTPGSEATHSLNVYTNADCSVRFKAGGNYRNKRTDIILDNIVVNQFRGGEWNDAVGYAENWVADNADGGYRQFVFTTSWIRDGAIMLSARRTTGDRPSSIRAPLYDNRSGRGVGLGMFAFNYRNAHEDVNLLLQAATNVTQSAMGNIDRIDANLWTTITNFSFRGLSPAELAGGTRSHYIGMHGVEGVMRLVMDPAVVEASKNLTDASKFPEIYITDVISRDEPALDFRAWWGWNLRTLGDDTDAEKRMYLYDFTSDLVQKGMSLALNNSVSDQVDDPLQEADYRQHQPFVQTPTFATNVVGEIAFKARKYDAEDAQPAQVTLYGSVSGTFDSPWTRLKAFIVSNDTFTTYTYKTEAGSTYAAFRLGVTGVPGVQSTNPHNQGPDGYETPVRVLIDEVLVSEAIRASLAFRGVGAFRNNLDTTGYVPNVPSRDEQPLAGESWGVQCEVFAAQLGGEIDFDRKPVVKLHWYEGEIPWGFENWRTNKAARSAVLSRATDTNLIYRSSYRTSPDAVVPPTFADSMTVQYELEVIFYTYGSTIPQTNYLSKAGSWVNPAWYRNVNKNDGKRAFSAYTLLDSVAPGWAWINEVNILGSYDENTWENNDKDYQYVEIAVPAEAGIAGWSVNFVEALSDEKVTTNKVATFGENELKPRKDGLRNMASNMVYRVIANLGSRQSGRLKYADGTLDGVWTISTAGSAQNKNGVINGFMPIAVQLVRASGVIEHEVSLIGENFYGPESSYYETYHPSNMVTRLNRLIPGSRFIYIGDDDQGDGVSLSVMTERGETKDSWFNDIMCTPGRINEGQIIDPDHPTPNGSSILVYAQLGDFGHIRQTVGESVNTNGAVILVIPKGSQKGTNITYTVDKWYELGSVTTNGVEAGWTSPSPGRYVATVGAGASNNVTVVATAKLDDRLVNDYGLGPDNKYRDAVVDWLEKGTDIHGRPWGNRDSDQIELAGFESLSGNYITNLTLTQMYWLDMDPTIGNLVLRGGMIEAPQPITRSVPVGGTASDYLEATNFKMGVKLYITNKTDDVASDYYNKPAWAPYVLRGLKPGEHSLDYTLTSTQSWNSVTFKVTGLLNNGLTKLNNRDSWIPLRWFVFNPDSFNEDFVSVIEVEDPFGTESPGYSAGWYDWVRENHMVPVFFSWSIDTRLRQFPVEDLKKENLYE